jgi:hypothetical protein
MALALWDGTGDLLVAAVALDHPVAWQPTLAEDLLGDARRPGLTEQEEAAPRGANSQA